MPDQQFIKNAAQPKGPPAPQYLERADWLRAAIDIFVDEGVDAVRITRLAQGLGVTRGSFYWHFKSRDELLAGIIAFWAQKNAQSIILATRHAQTLDGGMLELFSCWLDPQRFDPGLDMAMRDWARRSPDVRQKIRHADRECIAAIKAFFQRMGLEAIEANTRARTTYFSQIGYYAMGLNESLENRLTYLEDTVWMLSGRPLDPSLASRFRKEILGPEE